MAHSAQASSLAIINQDILKTLLTSLYIEVQTFNQRQAQFSMLAEACQVGARAAHDETRFGAWATITQGLGQCASGLLQASVTGLTELFSGRFSASKAVDKYGKSVGNNEEWIKALEKAQKEHRPAGIRDLVRPEEPEKPVLLEQAEQRGDGALTEQEEQARQDYNARKTQYDQDQQEYDQKLLTAQQNEQKANDLVAKATSTCVDESRPTLLDAEAMKSILPEKQKELLENWKKQLSQNERSFNDAQSRLSSAKQRFEQCGHIGGSLLTGGSQAVSGVLQNYQAALKQLEQLAGGSQQQAKTSEDQASQVINQNQDAIRQAEQVLQQVASASYRG